ncbi:hypothetical protein Tco_0232785 [Tanacetum coccineum]
MPPAPAASADNQALADWNALFYRHNEVACLVLGTMSPKLYHNLRTNHLKIDKRAPKDVWKTSGVELQELVNMFHSCKQAEGQSVSDHQLENKSQIVVLSFTPHVWRFQSGRVQKNKPQGKAKGKEKGKGLKNSYPTKPKKPQPYKKERPKKDGQCHHYAKKEGHRKKKLSFGLRGAKKLKRGSLYLYVGNGVRAEVEAIGSFDLYKPMVDFILQKGSGRNVELDYEDILPSENTSEHPIEEESLGPDVSHKRTVFFRRTNPSEAHWTAVKNILKYLRNTKDMFLMYGGNPEAELQVKSAKEAVWIRKFIDELGIVPLNDYPIKMNCDNSAAIIIAKESGIQKGARHFQKKYHYVRECIKTGEIDIVKVYTDENLADPFTKALAGSNLTRHARSMSLCPASSFM